MPYDIFGFVERRPPTLGPWLAVFSVGKNHHLTDHFSNEIFGLAKFAREDAPLANRGLPGDLSLEVQEWMASIAMFEMEEDAISGDHGHTYATLGELKKLNISPSPTWQVVLEKICALQRDFGVPDADIRVVLWANW